MTTKQKLAELLEKSEGEFFSGNLLAEKLGVTRAAVWKNIRQLEAEGYKIEAVTNRSSDKSRLPPGKRTRCCQ